MAFITLGDMDMAQSYNHTRPKITVVAAIPLDEWPTLRALLHEA